MSIPCQASRIQIEQVRNPVLLKPVAACLKDFADLGMKLFHLCGFGILQTATILVSTGDILKTGETIRNNWWQNMCQSQHQHGAGSYAKRAWEVICCKGFRSLVMEDSYSPGASDGASKSADFWTRYCLASNSTTSKLWLQNQIEKKGPKSLA